MGEGRGQAQEGSTRRCGQEKKARTNPNQPIPISTCLPLHWTTPRLSPNQDSQAPANLCKHRPPSSSPQERKKFSEFFINLRKEELGGDWSDYSIFTATAVSLLLKKRGQSRPAFPQFLEILSQCEKQFDSPEQFIITTESQGLVLGCYTGSLSCCCRSSWPGASN